VTADGQATISTEVVTKHFSITTYQISVLVIEYYNFWQQYNDYDIKTKVEQTFNKVKFLITFMLNHSQTSVCK